MASGEPPHTSSAEIPVPWRVVLLARGGARVASDTWIPLHIPVGESVTEVLVTTLYAEAGLAQKVPQQLVVEVPCAAVDADEAVVEASAVANVAASLMSFVVNGHVSVPTPYLAYEIAPGLTRRRFWQAVTEPEELGMQQLHHRLEDAVLSPFLQALYAAPEISRAMRALAQYHVALSHWTAASRALALAHLYMALEALTDAHQRTEQKRLGLVDEREHARALGIKVDRPDREWRPELQGAIRRDVICQGDQVVFKAVKAASDGFEHGFQDGVHIRKAAEQYSAKFPGYIRAAVLRLIDVDEPLRKVLLDVPALDASPVRHVIYGDLTGAVADVDLLGEQGFRYPRAEVEWTLSAAQTDDQGRLWTEHRMDFEPRVAPGVALKAKALATSYGLNDDPLAEAAPPNGMPPVEIIVDGEVVPTKITKPQRPSP